MTSSVSISVAGCRFVFEAESGGDRIPGKLAGLDFPEEYGAPDVEWRLRLGRATPVAARPRGPSLGGDGFEVTFEGRSVVASYSTDQPTAAPLAVQCAIFGALRREGRADLHAAAIVPPGSSNAIVLVGESGHGKSTVTLRAIAAGWGFLSDDLIAVFADSAGDLSLAPLRRTLRVAEGAIDLLPGSAGSSEWSKESPRKLIVDPEACGMGPRHARARPGRLIFLTRAAEKTIAPLSSAEAFRRLMLHSPHIAFDPGARAAIDALKRLADAVEARSAALPLDSLHDAQTLEDFLA
ncbi:MAG: hypothetical protein K1Y01_08665 [Vicinamibacteria bacterium]|nr:hypothetical protein [Vicinamibacteria bacterium]